MGTVSFGNDGARNSNGVQRILALVQLVAGAALAGVGAVLLWMLPWEDATRHLEARHWPTTQARIVSVSLLEESHMDGGERPASQLVLSVIYEYEVAGTSYTGYRASLNDRSDVLDRRLRSIYGRLNFARVMQRTVPVAYDPHAPEQALLDREFDWNAAAWRGGIALGVAVFGVVLVVAAARPRQTLFPVN